MDNDYEKETNGTIITNRTRIMLGNVQVATAEKVGAVTSIYYQFTNSVGSSTITTNTTGSVLQAQDTKPYGGYRVNTDTKALAATETTPATTGIKDYYALHERDLETGLTYMNARMYSETMPTFLSLDPNSEYNPQSLLNDPQQLNLYAYARNNPVRYNDPSGKFIVKNGTIEKGDTLNSIAKKLTQTYGQTYTVQQLASQNKIVNANKISTGSTINFSRPSTYQQYSNGVSNSIFSPGKNYGNITSGNASAAQITGAVIGTAGAGIATVGSAILLGGQALVALCVVDCDKVVNWPSGMSGPQVINGLQYTEHALLRMEPAGFGGRGIPPSVIENVINYGTKTPGNEIGTVVNTFENVTAVTNDAFNRIITIIKTGN